jgi:hypothetical protein
MKSDELNKLYSELKKGLSPTRLKEISIDIINRYRAGDSTGLSFYAGLLDIDPAGMKINRLFAKIIQHYHPDKYSTITNEIETHYHNREIDELFRLKTIFIFKEFPRTVVAREEIDIEETYSYDDEDFGYEEKNAFEEEILRDEARAEESELYDDREYGFIEAVNRLIFGNLDFTVNIGDMQGLEGELDLSDYEIFDLKGVEYCVSINTLNLSGNHIRKIEPLSRLTQLESLFLSENEIRAIDCLSELANLKELDLSFNEIEDVSVLGRMESLLYVNVLGNPIRDTGILKELAEKGVIVIY